MELTIKLPKREKDRLNRLALSYGLSLTELTHTVLMEIRSPFPSESLDEYDAGTRASLVQGLKDWKEGRLHGRL